MNRQQSQAVVEKLKALIPFKGADAIARDLVKLCRDAEHRMGDGSVVILLGMGMIDGHGNVRDEVRDLVLQSVRDDGKTITFELSPMFGMFERETDPVGWNITRNH